MDSSATQYRKTPAGAIAYHTIGDGPLDILFLTNWGTNVEVMGEEPSLRHFFNRLAGIGRVICFDKRGTGVSDPVPLTNLPALEDWMDDAREVLDAVGSERATLIGDTEGGPMAILFAATYPERISALILLNTFARMLRDADYPAGMPEEIAAVYRQAFEDNWGNAGQIAMTAPETARDERLLTWMARYQRLAMPPMTAIRSYAWVQKLDVRAALPNLAMPTLVIQRADNRYYRAGFGRYLARSIPGARYVELPGAECYPFHGVGCDQVLDEIEEFLTGARTPPEPSRVLATIMFTDIVNSTRHAAIVGDARWREILRAHNELIRRLLAQYRGRAVRSTGDGFLALFDGPARAINCAAALVNEVRRIGLEIRVGLHAGFIEESDGEIGGIAVHIANRVMSLAGPGSVLVSRTLKDLVVGSSFQFEDRGEHQLKGVPDEWQLFAVMPGARAGAGW